LILYISEYVDSITLIWPNNPRKGILTVVWRGSYQVLFPK